MLPGIAVHQGLDELLPRQLSPGDGAGGTVLGRARHGAPASGALVGEIHTQQRHLEIGHRALGAEKGVTLGTRRRLAQQRIIAVFAEFVEKRCAVSAATVRLRDLELHQIADGMCGVRTDAAHADHLAVDLQHQGAEARPPPIRLQPAEAVAVACDVGLGGGAEPPRRGDHSATASAKVAVSITARKWTSPATTRS